MRLPLLLPPVAADAGRRNVRLLAILRWLAVGGQFATILVASRVLHVALPLAPMAAALAALALLNIVVAQVATRRAVSDQLLFATFLADVAVLTLQLWVSGGVANPFVWLYLLQVVIAAVLLPAWASWTLAGLTGALFAALAASPHALPTEVGERLSPPAIAASWISYALAAGLLVLFVTRIVRNLAERDARLAALRQREAEQVQIVRMGLLASGAAHELGTPLASVAVMLGDWRRDAAVTRSPELLADVEAMSREVARCKDILGQILLAAGEVRGDRPVRTTLRALVRDTVAAWSGHDVAVTVDDRLTDDPAIVADRPLAQAITTLLDNAAEAGARRIAVSLSIRAGEVTLRVADDGRGFDAAMLMGFGEPYRSSKQRHGAGLGGFLASNVLRTLGGTATARNRDEGGAEILLRWPLAVIEAEA